MRLSCDDPIPAPDTGDEIRDHTLAMLDKHNIIGVASGPPELVAAYKQAAPERIMSGLMMGGGGWGELPSVDALRALRTEGRLDVIGELTTQYAGIMADDEILEPLWSFSEDNDIPVGIHIGPTVPGTIYRGDRNYRARLRSALTLEEVLVRHPRLRIYIMHAGWPMIDDLVAVLYAHPQVYVDVALINWLLPPDEFYRYLRRLVDAGFGSRVMHGSDQAIFSGLIEYSIKVINDAPFLSEAQKRDILYNNAARFLRLTEDEIARHHAM